VPASAVIPAPIVYTNSAAVKKLVVTVEARLGQERKGKAAHGARLKLGCMEGSQGPKCFRTLRATVGAVILACLVKT